MRLTTQALLAGAALAILALYAASATARAAEGATLGSTDSASASAIVQVADIPDNQFFTRDVPTPAGLAAYDGSDEFATRLMGGDVAYFRARLAARDIDVVVSTFERLVYAGPAAVPLFMKMSADATPLRNQTFSFYNGPGAFEATRIYRIATVGELAREGIHELTYVKSAALDYDQSKLESFYTRVFLPAYPVARHVEENIAALAKAPNVTPTSGRAAGASGHFMERVLDSDVKYFRKMLLSRDRETVVCAYQRLVYARDSALPVLQRLAVDTSPMSVTTFPYYLRTRAPDDGGHIRTFTATRLSDLAAFDILEITGKLPGASAPSGEKVDSTAPARSSSQRVSR